MCKDLEGAHPGCQAREWIFPGVLAGVREKGLGWTATQVLQGRGPGRRHGREVTLQAWVGRASSPGAHFSSTPCLVFRCSGVSLKATLTLPL